MVDFHKYTFGQMPARKAIIGDKVYRQLELGEVIDKEDYFSVKGVNKTQPVSNTLKIVGTKYNPHTKHKNMVVWRVI